MEAGQLAESLRLARQAENSPEKYRLLVHLRIRRREPGDLDKALEELQKWRRLAPADPEPGQRLVEIHLFGQDHKAATLALRHFKQDAPDQPMPHYLDGVLLQLAGNLEHALLAYARAIKATESQHKIVYSGDQKTLEVAAAMQLCEPAAGNYPGSRGVQQQ